MLGSDCNTVHKKFSVIMLIVVRSSQYEHEKMYQN